MARLPDAVAAGLHGFSVRLATVLAVGSRTDRLLRAALLAIVALVVLVGVRNMLNGYPLGVDLEIPLRAARRWVDGGQPYLASAFHGAYGYDLPFLYPPIVLPIVAPLLLVPRAVLAVAWAATTVAAAVWSCRRLAIPWAAVPFVLLWPPFFEALLGGNVQLLLFATFLALTFRAPGGAAPLHPVERDAPDAGRGDWRTLVGFGFLSVVNGVLKPSQVHPWVATLRSRPRAAIAGAVAVAAFGGFSLLLTGIDAWTDWIAQVGRASDPNWYYVGASLVRYVPPWVVAVVTVVSLVAAWLLPVRHRAAWLGIVMIVGGPSLRTFGLLFLLPGMLVVRREFAIAAAFFVATTFNEGFWLAVIVTAVPLALGRRWPAFLEPEDQTAATSLSLTARAPSS